MMDGDSKNKLTIAVEKCSEDWMAISGVVAVGQGEGCIIVYFDSVTSQNESGIPNRFQNFPVEKSSSGLVYKQNG